MPCAHSQAEWSRWKNSIQDLYVRQDLSLRCTMKRMEDRGFSATKSQYETQINQWSFKKRAKKEDWKVLNYKIGKRKQQGKDTILYFEGSLMPRLKQQKELSRQGYLNFEESLQWAEAPTPNTPTGFNIRTPTADSSFHLLLENLPIFRLYRELRNHPILQNHSVETVQLGLLLGNPRSSQLLSRLNSLLPTSALRDEMLVSELAIETDDRMTPIQGLGLAAYLLSNNIPIKIKAKELYKWFQCRKIFDQRFYQLSDNPSLEALMESVFCLAVEEEDVPTVAALIKAGANPNTNRCRFRALPHPLTPLQFACINGNLTLVNELLCANAEVNTPEPGWCCNILVLAINGYGKRQRFSPRFSNWGRDRAIGSVIEISENDMPAVNLREEALSRDQQRIEALVRKLIDFGANVNHLEQDDIARAKFLNQHDPKELSGTGGESWMYPLVMERNSPLTLASRYRATHIVELLIQAGAQVDFCMDGRHTAVEQCFYNHSELHSIREVLNSESQRFLHELSVPDLTGELKVALLCYYTGELQEAIATAKALWVAGASFTNHEPCLDANECQHSHFECYSILDFAIWFSATTEEIGTFLALGAVPSKYSLDLALHQSSFSSFQLLVESGAPIPDWAESWYDQKRIRTVHTEADRVEFILNLRRQRALILGAIHLNDAKALEILLSAAATFSPSIFKGLDSGTLTAAIESCSQRDDGNTLRCLIESNVLSGFGRHVFGASLARALSSRCRTAMKILLAAGADVNRGFTKSEDMVQTPLSVAMDVHDIEAIDMLMVRMAQIETAPSDPFLRSDTSSEGNLLVKAISTENEAIIQRFLDAKPSLEALGRELDVGKLYSPLAIAIKTKQWALFDLLQASGADIDHPEWDLSDPCLVTPLRAAVEQDNEELVLSLLNLGVRLDDLETLHLAATKPRTSELILSNLSKDIVLWNTIGVKMCRQWLGHFYISSGMRQKVVRMLVDSYADINCLFDRKYDEGAQSTVLIAILEAKDLQSARILLNAGASVDFLSEDRVLYTPLQLSSQHPVNMQMVQLLLSFGCNPNYLALWAEGQPRRCSAAPLQNAVQLNDLELTRLLLEHGARPDILSAKIKQTALQVAVQNGNTDIMNLLLEYGADVNFTATGNGSVTALQLAAEKGYLGMATLLVEKGADINAAGSGIDGWTAFEAAAANGKIDMVRFLKNAGVDLSETAGQYERALSLAFNHGFLALRRDLLSWLN